MSRVGDRDFSFERMFLSYRTAYEQAKWLQERWFRILDNFYNFSYLRQQDISNILDEEASLKQILDMARSIEECISVAYRDFVEFKERVNTMTYIPNDPYRQNMIFTNNLTNNPFVAQVIQSEEVLQIMECNEQNNVISDFEEGRETEETSILEAHIRRKKNRLMKKPYQRRDFLCHGEHGSKIGKTFSNTAL